MPAFTNCARRGWGGAGKPPSPVTPREPATAAEGHALFAYLSLFAVPAWLAYTQRVSRAKVGVRPHGPWLMSVCALALLIGLRHEVGGDWFNYTLHIETAQLDPWAYAATWNDPAFAALTALGALWGGDYLVNAVCAVAFSCGLAVFCRAQPHPWLAFTVAVPYLVIVVAMGYTRQGVAIGLAMAGITALTRGRLWAFLAYIASAALFHKTAVVLFGLALFSGTGPLWARFVVLPALAAIVFAGLLADSVGSLYVNYVQAAYDSAGAAIRVTMNALPAAVFLLLRKRFKLAPSEQRFWTLLSITALLTVPVLMVSPSSTAVDRLALYWIPIQLFVWSRLPLALARFPSEFRLLTACVILYSLAVLLVWLLFAHHSFAWLPYRFYPLVWIQGVF